MLAMYDSVFDNLDKFDALGGASLGHVLFALVVGFLVVLGLLAAMVRIRGQSPALTALCARDVLIACGLAVTVLGAPVAFLFMGRALWRAATFEG